MPKNKAEQNKSKHKQIQKLKRNHQNFYKTTANQR